MKSLSLNRNKLNIGQVFKVANVSLYILAAICFMVYTTNNYTHAENNDEDLGYDIKSADASVTVGTACTFTATVDSAHNANISNGIYSTNIGKTTLNTICNDSGGYAVYAIGYTGDEYGATNLSSDISSTYNISTGTNTSGDSSSWAMKLAPEPGTTTATIENGYNNYNIVPDDYTKVATLNTITDNTSTSSITGSSISTTYQTYISPTQPAGTYTGKVKYTLVHPSTAPAPEKPITIEQAYQKSGATKTAQGYYRMQDMNSIIANKKIIVGSSAQLQDIRDDKIYWVTKMKDGNIWMTQNLDLDIEANRTYTSADTDLAYSNTDTTWTPNLSTYTTSTWNSSSNSFTEPCSYDPGDRFWDGIITAYGGSINNNTTTSGDTHYHIGNYYNWTAAIATNDTDNIYSQVDMNQSICPAGWRLSTYSDNKSYLNLMSAESLISGIDGNIQNHPAYFVYSGYWTGGSVNVGRNGYYWSSHSVDIVNARLLVFNANGQLKPQESGPRNYGFSVRCVAR